MGLQAFVRRPDVRAKFRALRPNCPKKVRGLYRLVPATQHRLLVDAAFKYLLGFEIMRLAPHARCGQLGAHKKLNLLRQSPIRVSEEILRPLEAGLEAFEIDIKAYTMQSQVDDESRKTAARLALKLAKLEFVSVIDDPRHVLEYQADPRDVLDLLAMIEVAPLENFVTSSDILLWPELPNATPYVHAANIEFIIGDRIVEVTTTQNTTIHNYILDELMGRLFLALKEHELDPSFPAVTRASLYYARYGYTLTLNAEELIQHDSFHELYDWFFDVAAQTYRYSPPSSASLEKNTQSKSAVSRWWGWLSAWWSKKS